MLYCTHQPNLKFTVSRESIVFLLGVITFFVPVIGVPPAWKEYSLWAIGFALVLLGVSLRRSAYLRRISQNSGELRTDSFVESQPTSLDIHTDSPENKEV